MQFRRHSIAVLALAALMLPLAALGAQINTMRIEGIVYGPDRKPVDRCVVRLIDEGGFREVGRTMSDQGGRWRLDVAAGTYFVDIDPVTRPELAKSRQEVELMDAPGLSAGARFNLSTILKPAAGAVSRFDQQVPIAARTEYDNAIRLIATDRAAGLAALRKAIEIFPDYYDALETLGTEYAKDGHLDAAVIVLRKAVEVHPKSERSHYGLGVAYYRKGLYDLAIESFNKAAAVDATSPNTTLYQGLAHAKAGHDAEAEQFLKKAYGMGATGVPDLHLALTGIYRKGNRNKEAANQLRTLLKEVPNMKDKDKINELIKKYDAM
jgi:tetratricopeptide (TPR) repeat protein